MDLYEFIVLYGKVTTGQATVAGVSNEGHRLSLRSIECIERIMNVTQGTGRSLAGAEMRYLRSDR